MRKSKQNITYTFVSQNTDVDIKKALQKIIIERLLLLHKEKLFATH